MSDLLTSKTKHRRNVEWRLQLIIEKDKVDSDASAIILSDSDTSAIILVDSDISTIIQDKNDL